jgi:LuxR family transcriptional regulator, maltose regulon positive regulatory protein
MRSPAGTVLARPATAASRGVSGIETRDPAVLSQLVPRERLVRRLLAAVDVPLILLVAPAGYGKTTLLRQWEDCDDRPFAWVGFGELAQAVRGLTNPTVVSVDDAHVYPTPEAREWLPSAVEALPAGSQIVLAARREPALPLARLRAHRCIVELGVRDLALTRGETAQVVSNLGLDLRPPELEALAQRTEGWAAVVYLAALSHCGQGDALFFPGRFGGDHRLVADYLSDEVLLDVPADDLDFMIETSVLDRLAGALCDAVLVRTRSACRLRALSRSNLLVRPLDSTDAWYRYHPLLLEMLRAELRRADPERESDLRRRASRWHADHGDVEAALEQAIAAGDVRPAGELLWRSAPGWVARGRNRTVGRWLARFTEREVATTPTLALTAALSHLANGEGDLAERWAATAGALTGPKRRALAAALDVFEAALGRAGIADMAARSGKAGPFAPSDSAGRSLRCLITGVGLHLAGDCNAARDELEAGMRDAALAAPAVQALCLAQLALLAADQDDWQGASALATRARSHAELAGLGGYPTMALVYAVSAAARARAGQVEGAAEDAARASRLMKRLRDFAPWYETEVRIVLARAALRLSDVPRARALLAEASRHLARTPDAVVLQRWLDQGCSANDAFVDSGRAGSATLTTAELRVLQSLPTHLSLREIAESMRVSQNTVKTQAHAVYRKLDASSRSEAVDRAQALGLLDLRRAA